MKTTIKEVENTFDEDNYIQCNEDGTFTVFTGTEGDTFQTEAEAVSDWVELWNDFDQFYYVDTKHNHIHANLTDKAQKVLDETDPLNIIERRYDCEYVYQIKGVLNDTGLTEDELNEALESFYDAAHLEEEK